MSDHVAHIAICDDTFRLAAHLDAIDPVFKRLMAEQREAAHMGSVTRYADKWTVRIVSWATEQYAGADADRDPKTDQKLAFTLGSLTHRAADRLTKPITKCWSGDDKSGPHGSEANESKIMQDIFMFKEVYASGFEGQGLFSPQTLNLPPTEPAHATELIYRLLLRRALIGMHTINPDPTNIHAWFDRFFDGLQEFPKSIEQYVELAAEWDPAKVKKYLTDKNFYSRDDALIKLTRDAQRGSTINAVQVEAALVATDPTDKVHSRYARALSKALEYLIAAGELFRGEIDCSTASERFDIGVPELSIQD